jgi:hypothetical protein
MIISRCMHLAVIATIGLLLHAPAVAGDIAMANGAVRFSVPADWVPIMQTQGDPETQVFQVPDPSPAGAKTLSRVTVSVKQAGNLAGYQSWMGQQTARARQLAGYAPDTHRAATPNDYFYTAQEAGEKFSYHERYAFSRNLAIQLRCVRPSAGDARWQATFDAGCDDIATHLPQ